MSLVACGGGGGGGGGTSGGGTLPPTPVTQSAAVQFSITVPQSVQRSPKYISRSTASASIQVSPAGGTPQTPVTLSCSSASCSTTLQAPVGTDQFTVKLYDGANGTGNVLSQGTATQTVVAGATNTLSVTFAGVVAKINLALAQSTISAAGTVGLTVTALDAANQTIIGTDAYTNPITLTDTDASGTTSLSATSVTSPATTVTLTYTGGAAFTSAAIGAAAPGVLPSNVTGASLTKVAIGGVGGGSGPVAFLTSGAGSISPSSTSATVLAISEYQTPILSAPADVASTEQGNIALQVGSNLTPLGALRQTLGAPPSHTSINEETDPSRDLPLSNDWNDKYGKNVVFVSAPPHHQVTKKSLPVVGTQQSFYISSGAIGTSGGAFVSVPFTLAATSNHTLIWLDNSLSSTVVGYANQIAAIAENAYLSDTAKYAPFDYTAASTGYINRGHSYCDATGAPTGTSGLIFIDPPAPGVVNVMVANGGSGGPLGTGVGGYFTPLNYLSQNYANCYAGGQAANPSNQVPMIVVGWFSNGTLANDQYELQEDLVRSTAHELQHLVNFVNHVIINGQSNNDPTWLNEGMSMLAQDLVSSGGLDIDDALRHATLYLAHPQENSLTGFLRVASGVTPTLTYNCSSCYGGSYLFARYMYDRFGSSAFTQNMTTGSTFGSPSLVRLSNYSDFPSLLGDFATALAVSNTGVSTDPRYNFTGINLRQTYPSPHGGVSQVFTGPKLLPVAAGNGVSITGMPAGAFAYYTVTGLTGSGNAVKLTDTTGATSKMALTGSIVQH